MKMGFSKTICVCLATGLALGFIAACVLASSITPNIPAWVSKNKYRLLVRVDPKDLGTRRSDEMPAAIQISSSELHKQIGGAGKIAVSSIQVARYDPTTGRPVPYGKWAYARADWDVPVRWYDSSIAEEFPGVEGSINGTEGELRYQNNHGWGYLYETVGEWDSGQLAWIHTQQGSQPSYYAVYFDFLPDGKEPDRVERRGFLGDGYERITEVGPTTHGLRLGRVETVDWNGDGLTDLLVGSEGGGMIWLPNHGSQKQPQFPYAKLMFMADGRPLDVGFSSTPLAIDWDGDGLRDLLVGAWANRAVWYKNIGTAASAKMEYRGFVLADGKPLSLPHEPVPESEGIYKTDYNPVLISADWDGDGDSDLLAGGYVTGMIYWFENNGRGKDNLPELKFQGPVEADGQPIDTEWCAAPTVADFDHDGDLDLITGGMAMDAAGGERSSSEDYLYYFKNNGNAKKPQLTRTAFPLKGKFHPGRTATPRAADVNGDSLLDLIVSEAQNIYLFLNIGTATAPLWEYSPVPLEGKWNSAPFGQLSLGVLPYEIVDWNKDGRFDFVSGFSVGLNEGKGNPQLFGPLKSVLAVGEEIFHKSPRGDQWTFTHACDLDSDGKMDFLYGVHEGHVYFHRNLSRGGRKHFDTGGLLLQTTDGNPIKVGLHPGKWDFDVLQGARTAVTAGDYDRDGKVDIVVADTYGKLRYYRNASGGSSPIFSPPELIADTRIRLVPTTADWNADGWPDLLLGVGGEVQLLLNLGKKDAARFGKIEKINVQPLPYESTVMVVDWNNDGDDDLIRNATYGYLCWYDASFIKHGYATGELRKVEYRGAAK